MFSTVYIVQRKRTLSLDIIGTTVEIALLSLLQVELVLLYFRFISRYPRFHISDKTKRYYGVIELPSSANIGIAISH